ncbi:MAG: hypothetical protein HYS12_29940 [Planctomycetes bacterium]|nr:hypothetical protein [Planctomycetota bacterium]
MAFFPCPPPQAMHLTGAAFLVSRGIKLLQAAPAGELGRSALITLRGIRLNQRGAACGIRFRDIDACR